MNQPTATPRKEYIVPIRLRKMENLHIVFWLFKDISWCMLWRPLGMAMVIPTVLVAFWLAYRTRGYLPEFCHNLAVICWISANSYWMICEFYEFDTEPLIHSYTYKHLALIPFCLGLIPLIFYYLYWKPRHPKEVETM
jgi:uncharacterized protein involved in cysteine biosynthesis